MLVPRCDGNLMLVPRATLDPSEWDAIVEQHPNGWCWHLSGWLDYQVLARPNAMDLSVGCVDGGRLVGVIPLIAQDGTACMDGRPSPLLPDDLSALCTDLAREYMAAHGVHRWIYADRPSPSGEAHHHTRVVTLASNWSTQWKDVRHSYRSLIHKAERNYLLEIHTGESCVTPFAVLGSGLHHQVSGRATRPFETWQLMEKWLKAGRAMVVSASERERGWIGFIYLYAWKGWAYYGSAAVLVDDLTHALQWTALKALPTMHVTHYEMGYLPPDPTEKDLGIQKFKTGFGGEDWSIQVHCVTF